MSQSLCCGLCFYLREIVGGVVRHCDLVMKIMHIYIYFFLAFVGDSRKFMLSKISRYTVFLLCLILRHMEGH